VSGLGKPVLVPAGAYIHLAHQTKSGVQLSIENWTSLDRARLAFGSAAVEVEQGLFVTPAQIRIIAALMGDGEMTNKRGMKALVKSGLVAGPWRKKTDRPALTERGRVAAGVLSK
jgi:hypothetical protein